MNKKVKDLCHSLKKYHDDGRVHGKISNDVLIYKDGSYSLPEVEMDFIKYKRTHRSLDAWKGECSLSSDIFALGCTLYTITYGHELFDHIDSDIKQKQLIYNFSLCNHTCINYEPYCELTSPVKISSEWVLQSNRIINNVILKCLHCDPRKRPNIDDIIRELNI